jgi:hypothetical protein
MSDKALTSGFIPEVLDVMFDQIQSKLRDSQNIVLITDGWTNKQMVEFLALGACLTHKDFRRECLIIGFVEMKNGHTSETVKRAVEEMIERFDFDKSKVKDIVSDEGSPLVKLFKQIPCNNQNKENDVNTSSSNELLFYYDFSSSEDDNESIYSQSLDAGAGSEELGDSLLSEDEYLFEIDDIDLEIDELKNELKDIEIVRMVEQESNMPDDREILNSLTLKQDDEQYYDLSYGRPLTDPHMSINASTLLRFSCAAHKCNLAVRKAIEDHKSFSRMLSNLSYFASNTGKSIGLSRIYREKKSRLRTVNNTRWSSSFLMIQSFLKAYKNGCFDAGKIIWSFCDFFI